MSDKTTNVDPLPVAGERRAQEELTISVRARQTYESGKGGTLHVRFADNVARVTADGEQVGEVASCIGGSVEVVYEGRHYTIEPLDLYQAVRQAVEASSLTARAGEHESSRTFR